VTGTPPWQTWLFVCIAVFAVLTTGLLKPDLMVQMLVLAPFVAVFGLPHGALDLPIAGTLLPFQGATGKALFAGLYLALSGLVVLVWVLVPGPSLFAFLIYSAVHFSGDWIESPAALRWSGGAATIGGPALFHRQEVARIFGYLAPENSATLAAICLAAVGGVALAMFIALLILHPVTRTRAAAEQVAIWIAAALLSPIIYFIVYFCALHSVRHTVDTVEALGNPRRALLIAGLVSAVTALAAVSSVILLDGFNAGSTIESVSKTIFIGLAALTVPHMVIVDRFQRQKRDSKRAL